MEQMHYHFSVISLLSLSCNRNAIREMNPICTWLIDEDDLSDASKKLAMKDSITILHGEINIALGESFLR